MRMDDLSLGFKKFESFKGLEFNLIIRYLKFSNTKSSCLSK
jgi:hypothetical protein